MNLRGIANSVARVINPNTAVTVKVSTGYSIDPVTRKQVPSYTQYTGYAQVQALDGSDLKHLDGLNIQGTLRAIYLYGNLAGVIRPDTKGGDIIMIAGKTWLVVKVIETWPGWCKVAVNYQGAA